VYSTRLSTLCDNDLQSLWIIGGPGTEDPDFDDYPANRNIYTTYGPLNLTTAQEARVSFSLFFRNNMDIQDTICWGADSVFTLATTHIWVDTTFSGQTSGWQTFVIDLKDLHRNIPTRDSVSALGRPAVYVFWWFRSDGDAIVDKGAFIDDVIVSVDDGSVDLLAGGMGVREPDGTTVPTRIETGDSIRAQVTWSSCDGGVAVYDDFHARLFLDGELIYDSLMSGVLPGETNTWLSDPIEMTTAGNHQLQFHVDALFEVEENNENNNLITYPFVVEEANVPPTFQWVIPSTDTLRSYGSVVLSWLLFDPDDEATMSLHVDTDTMGCVGPLVPRTAGRGETEIPDTVTWSTSGLPIGQVRWIFAQYSDLLFQGCSYAPWPVLIMPLSAGGEPQFIPITFNLSQNYPNPFNPQTKIEFSLTRGGATTLKVYDITGREIATLIDNDLTPGFYETNFDAGMNRPSGVYLYRLDAPEGSITKKMILMK